MIKWLIHPFCEGNTSATATTEYLELFFENLLLGKNNELKNRYLHIDFQSDIQSDNSKNQNVTLNESALLKLIAQNPSVTQIQLAEKMNVTDRTIKRKMKSLQEKSFIKRVNGKRNGYWEILIDF